MGEQKLHYNIQVTSLTHIEYKETRGDSGFINVPLVPHTLNKSCLAHLLSQK